MKTALGTPDRGDDGNNGTDWYTSHRPEKNGQSQHTKFPVTAPKIPSYGSYTGGSTQDYRTARNIHKAASASPMGSARLLNRNFSPGLIAEDAKAADVQAQLWREAKGY